MAHLWRNRRKSAPPIGLTAQKLSLKSPTMRAHPFYVPIPAKPIPYSRSSAAFSSLLVLSCPGLPYSVRFCPKSCRRCLKPSVPLRSCPCRSGFDLRVSHLPSAEDLSKFLSHEIHLRRCSLSAICIHQIWQSQAHTSTARPWRNSLRNLPPPRPPSCVVCCRRFKSPCARERLSNRSGNDYRKMASTFLARRFAGSFAEHERNRAHPRR